MRHMSFRRLTLALCVVGFAATPALANTSHAGWPSPLVRQQNKLNLDETITGRPGVHNELLGGAGNDTIVAANDGDVLWGDYNPDNNPTTQVDRLTGGTGKDFIYASHGTNYITTNGGGDVIHAHYGRGQIHCGSKTDLVYISHKSLPHYKLTGCKRISFKTLGF